LNSLVKKEVNKKIILVKNVNLTAIKKIKYILTNNTFSSLDVILKEKFNECGINNVEDIYNNYFYEYNFIKEIILYSIYLNEKLKLICDKNKILNILNKYYDGSKEKLDFIKTKLIECIDYKNKVYNSVLENFVDKLFEYGLEINKFVEEYFFSKISFFKEFSTECNSIINLKINNRIKNNIHIYLISKGTNENKFSAILNKIIFEIFFYRDDIVLIKFLNKKEFKRNKFRKLELNKT
jgi:hypothetical protein